MLSLEAQADARCTAGLILAAHRGYLAEFNAITEKAKETFENRAWTQGALDAARRVQLYRDAVNGTWQELWKLFPDRVPHREFWMGARQVFLEKAFDDYEADIALTFFYSTMRLAFDAQDIPVEYADDGLAERSPVWSQRPIWHVIPRRPTTSEPVCRAGAEELHVPRALGKCRSGRGIGRRPPARGMEPADRRG